MLVMLEVDQLGVHICNEEGDNIAWEDNLNRCQGMILNVASLEFGMYFESSEELF